MEENLKLQMKANFSTKVVPPISVLGFFAIFKLVCDTNNIHEGAAMWLLPFFVNNTFSITLNSLISAAAHIFSIASVNTFESPTQKKLLLSYPEVVNHC